MNKMFMGDKSEIIIKGKYKWIFGRDKVVEDVSEIFNYYSVRC